VRRKGRCIEDQHLVLSPPCDRSIRLGHLRRWVVDDGRLHLFAFTPKILLSILEAFAPLPGSILLTTPPISDRLYSPTCVKNASQARSLVSKEEWPFG
jgi:hypothetical protein